MTTKEEQQRAVNAKRKLRSKQIAQLKASNEMLEAAKEGIIKRYGEGSDSAEELINDIDIAKEQNLERAASYLGASKNEVESIQYNKVNPAEEKAYFDRLARQGKSDEELHRKDLTNGGQKQIKTEKKTKLQILSDKLRALTSSNKPEVNNEMVDIEEDVKPMTKDEYQKLVNNKKDDNDGYFNQFKKKSSEQQSVGETEKKNMDKSIEHNEDNSTRGSVDIDTVIDEGRKYTDNNPVYEDFDPRDIPSYVQYDMIPLPSKGECYSHKKKTVPMAYLTAADENLIVSPNLYNNGQFIDIMLDRKILDKSIRAKDLCNGDRDALVIWLRATAYGPEYPIIATKDGKEFNTTVDLSGLDYYEFNLKGDENGYFKYTTENGDEIKYKILTHGEEMEIRNSQAMKINAVNAYQVKEGCKKILENVNNINGKGKEDVKSAIELVSEWAEKYDVEDDKTEDVIYNEVVTLRMKKYTMSVNGNSDREFVETYVDNMRALEAKKYREYVMKHTPGVDLTVDIQVPESLGGGSFKSFLDYGEYVFVNV